MDKMKVDTAFAGSAALLAAAEGADAQILLTSLESAYFGENEQSDRSNLNRASGPI